MDIYKPCLVSFLAFDHGHYPQFVGSGFIIGRYEEYAFALTAKHVLTEGAIRSQQPYDNHAPSALFVPPSAESISISPDTG